VYGTNSQAQYTQILVTIVAPMRELVGHAAE
jgi:hypothetical protein